MHGIRAMRRVGVLLALLALAACGPVADDAQAPPVADSPTAPADAQPEPPDAEAEPPDAEPESDFPDVSATDHAETPAGEAAAELVVEPAELGPDGTVTTQVRNIGEVPLLHGSPVRVHRWDGERWVDAVRGDLVWTMELYTVPPGQTGEPQEYRLDALTDVAPGWYRISKEVTVDDAQGGDVTLLPAQVVEVED